MPELDSRFTGADLDSAIQHLRTNSAAGPDLVPNKLIKLFGSHARAALLQLFNLVLRSGHWPADWSEGLIVPIFKPGGNRTAINDYRPITLLSCVGKLLESMVNARLAAWAERLSLISEEQGGFRRG